MLRLRLVVGVLDVADLQLRRIGARQLLEVQLRAVVRLLVRLQAEYLRLQALHRELGRQLFLLLDLLVDRVELLRAQDLRGLSLLRPRAVLGLGLLEFAVVHAVAGGLPARG